MPTVTLEEAQRRLSELITTLIPGEELRITRDDWIIATLVRLPEPSQEPRKPGSAIGKLTIVSDDDEHLKDFEEYMK